ncbi:hypothetical protein [Streptomyces sp. 351MFTsu5.1]|uniref:hypothetical protein n=1 Tax=Streptomyces sp. 351MFTsu5.1 TaxID=1172180 RepID=UPI000362D160|nr:hypothetical protein [Streptomyces sp. 351MFTsu5.1]
MAELPTATAPSTTPDVTRALRQIEAAKLGVTEDVAECLDAIGDLIRITGAPASILAWAHHTLSRETLRQYAAQQHIKLHESRATDEEQLARVVVIWAADSDGLAILPGGQNPATSLLQLREEVAQRQEDQQRAADFQASVAAGHVEDVDSWHARVAQAAQ